MDTRKQVLIVNSKEAEAWHLGHWQWVAKYLRKNSAAIVAGTDEKFMPATKAEVFAAALFAKVKVVKLKNPNFKL